MTDKTLARIAKHGWIVFIVMSPIGYCAYWLVRWLLHKC